MDLARIVVAHTSRIEQAQRLADRIGAHHVSVDDGTLGAWGNHRAALRYGIDLGASHVLTLEDDALPITTFPKASIEAIEQRPSQVLGLYVGRQRPYATQVTAAVEQAEGTNASWLTSRHLMWGVATIWPADIARDFLAWKHTSRMWDSQASRWLRQHGHDVAYCWPSLVDHADTGSVIDRRAKRQPGRVAHRVGHPTWTGGEVRVG